MCLSASYFAITMPPIILLVWSTPVPLSSFARLIIPLVLQKYYLRTSRQMRLLDLEAKSPLYSHFIESLSGLVTIRAFGWGDYFQVTIPLLGIFLHHQKQTIVDAGFYRHETWHFWMFHRSHTIFSSASSAGWHWY